MCPLVVPVDEPQRVTGDIPVLRPSAIANPCLLAAAAFAQLDTIHDSHVVTLPSAGVVRSPVDGATSRGFAILGEAAC